MNERDSETLAGYLEERGFCHEENPKAADIVLINTCSIRENADKRFFGTLGQLKKKKEKDPNFKVGVCGCMMQQEVIREQILKKYPWVDMVFGTHNIHQFPELLDQAGDIHRDKRHPIINVWEDGGPYIEDMPYKPLFNFKSFVNIMLGCNNFCTYCIVPYTRGRERSRTVSNILREISHLAAQGVKEVTLLGQNVNSFRDESDGTTKDFTDLIYEIAKIEGIERIRFMTSHPKDLSDKLIDAFKNCDKLCKYIHLPVQAGGNEVLRRMNRRYTREQYLELIRKLREAVPNITISTDIIVGFPGETEEDFQDTLKLVEEVDYDSAFTFLYSIRPGTPAEKYEDQIPEEVKHERFERLVEAVNRHSAQKNKLYEGKIEKVLVEGESDKNPGALFGRTDGFKLVNFPKPVGMTEEEIVNLTGTFCDVEITTGKTFSLEGTFCPK